MRLAPYCVELSRGEWTQLERSEYIQHAVRERWMSVSQLEGKYLCVLARDALDSFLAAGGRLWRYKPVEVDFITALRAIIETIQQEESGKIKARAHRTP